MQNSIDPLKRTESRKASLNIFQKYLSLPQFSMSKNRVQFACVTSRMRQPHRPKLSFLRVNSSRKVFSNLYFLLVRDLNLKLRCINNHNNLNKWQEELIAMKTEPQLSRHFLAILDTAFTRSVFRRGSLQKRNVLFAKRLYRLSLCKN